MTKKILLADDSLTIQKVVELTFSDSDYELICVSNGQRALDRLQDDTPDLILADVVMPEKNGYEVCETIKANPATAGIPVVLLSGTFEPFDRQRAERIGADAIVSKPFDSQQLLAQIEALLDRGPGRAVGDDSASAATRALSPEPEPEPFDVGFSAEDFTASIRRPPEGMDPFEEDYGRGDADAAIEEFERSRPEFQAEAGGTGPVPERRETIEPIPDDGAREPLAQWLGEEPEKARRFDRDPHDVERTMAVRLPEPMPPPRADEGPTQEIPQLRVEARAISSTAPELSGRPAEEITAAEAEELFEVPGPTEVPPEPEPAAATAPEASGSAAEQPERGSAVEVPREIEMLAQNASIPELTQMLSSVAKNGGELTDEQIERVAARVVEKLSDRIVREIAWEVIPDMAEIVIKQRIKELEAGIE